MPEGTNWPQKTIRERIVAVLCEAQAPKALHEFPNLGTNESTLSNELRRMAREVPPLVGSRRREVFKFNEGKMEMRKKRYKEWWLVGSNLDTQIKDSERAQNE